ncbi:MAG: signal peptidase I, partial [Nocardioides sp.]
SMSPRVNEGDLVVVRPATNYAVGDVVAYRSSELQQVVLHRVIKINEGRYFLRGDDNNFTDPEQPTDQQVVGKEVLHVPKGGIWLRRLTSPVPLAIIALTLLLVGHSAAGPHPRRTVRRQRRRKTRIRTWPTT